VDKQEQFRADYHRANDLLSAVERKRSAANKAALDTVEDYSSRLTQLKVSDL
jgi:hypothetical protein